MKNRKEPRKEKPTSFEGRTGRSPILSLFNEGWNTTIPSRNCWSWVLLDFEGYLGYSGGHRGENCCMQRRKGLSIPKQGESLQHIAPDLRANAVAIAPLILDPKNPRQGDVDLVAGSLRTYKQQKPIVIFKYPDQDRFTVIAGNHTTRGAIQNGWKYIAVTEFRGTPAEAQAFALMDNRSSDVATYNDEALAEVLGKIDLGDSGDLFSLTGYTDDELTYLKSRLDDEDFEDEAEEPEEGDDNPLEAVDNLDVESVVAYKGYEDLVFPSESNGMGIPDLDWRMLADPPDRPIKTWPGFKFADKNWQDYWMLVWSWSMKNAPFERCYLSFYAFDKAFESVWSTPGRFATNFSKNGVKAVVSPNFSLWIHRPYPERLWNLYRGRWLGRFFQEAGLKIIPDIDTGVLPEDHKIFTLGIPDNPPCVSIQLQTGLGRANKFKSNNELTLEATKFMISDLQPESLIVYGSQFGHELTDKGVFPRQLHVIRLATTQDVKRHKYEPDPLQGRAKSYKRKRRRRPTEEGGETK